MGFRNEKIKPKDFLTACVCILLIGTFSEDAENWSGESIVTAVQGESVTLTWNVSLTGSHASKTWTYVKILHAEGANTDESVTFKRTGEILTDNPSHSSRRSDMTFNVSQSGLVVTIRFIIANLVRSTDMKNYKAVLGFSSDTSTYPSVTALTVLVRPHSTEFTIKPSKNSFCIGDQVNLTCKADAIPPAQISLFRNDHLVQNGNTSATLSLTLNVKGKNHFICVPNNTAGTGQTRDLKLLVKEPPKIVRCRINGEEVQSKSFNEGTKVTLSCDLTGSEPLDVAWNKVNEQNSLSQTNTLTLNSIQRGQSGQYRVTVYNGPECDKTEVKILHVGVMYLDKPAVHGKAHKFVSFMDPEVEFKVTIDGNPQPCLTCDREDGLQGDVSVILSSTLGTKTTFLVRIYATNDEEYDCIFRSAAGNRHLKLKLYKQMGNEDRGWTNYLYEAIGARDLVVFGLLILLISLLIYCCCCTGQSGKTMTFEEIWEKSFWYGFYKNTYTKRMNIPMNEVPQFLRRYAIQRGNNAPQIAYP